MKQTLRSRGELCPKSELNIKILYTIYITFTIILVSCVCTRAQVSASSQEAGPAAEAVSEIKPLKIGDTIPDDLWSMPLQMVKAGQEGTTTLILNDYKGKLIILDFWATWCGSCIKSLNNLNTLQGDSLKGLVILPVTKQEGNKVQAFLEKKDWHLPSIIDDGTLEKLFPHRTIPHAAWINQGRVEAITDSKYTSKEVIQDFLNGKRNMLHNKFELLHFNQDRPDILNIEGVGRLVASVLTDHIIGAPSYISFTPNRDTSSVFLINTSIVNMLKTVFNTDTVQLLVSDSLARAMNYTAYQKDIGQPEQDWEKYSKSYTLTVSKVLSKYHLWQLAQHDLTKYLNLYYGVNVYLQKKRMPCYEIRRIGNQPLVRSSGGKPLLLADGNTIQLINKPIGTLTKLFKNKFIFNTSGSNHKIDLFIKTGIHDFVGFRNALPTIGLEIVEAEREMEVLVVEQAHKN